MLHNSEGPGIDDDENSFFNTIMDENDAILSRWGVRASSLNDIIRYMIYLRFKLDVINKVCKEITKRYEMDKELAYKVFKETEDEFTIRDYVKDDKEKINIKDKGLEGLDCEFGDKFVRCVKLCLGFLAPKDAFEVMVLNRGVYLGTKDAVYNLVLKGYNLNKIQRVQLWKCLIPDVRN